MRISTLRYQRPQPAPRAEEPARNEPKTAQCPLHAAARLKERSNNWLASQGAQHLTRSSAVFDRLLHAAGNAFSRAFSAMTGRAPRTIPNGAAQKALSLSPAALAKLRTKFATCPFIGSAVKMGLLSVHNSAANPTASIGDVAKLGDSGGGNLGSLVLSFFAQGNQAKTLGADGKLDASAPPGMFGLIFPGSQGAHPGHSGILMGNPNAVGSGRFDPQALGRLMSKAKDGYLSRSSVAEFIAQNMARDPSSALAWASGRTSST